MELTKILSLISIFFRSSHPKKLGLLKKSRYSEAQSPVIEDVNWGPDLLKLRRNVFTYTILDIISKPRTTSKGWGGGGGLNGSICFLRGISEEIYLSSGNSKLLVSVAKYLKSLETYFCRKIEPSNHGGSNFRWSSRVTENILDNFFYARFIFVQIARVFWVEAWI
jgi:hypothetical protein